MKNSEFEKFKKFYNNYELNYINLQEKDNKVYYNNLIIADRNTGETIAETDEFINVGYKLKGPFSKVLSNLFPYKFNFKGKEVKSIESVFQAIKFPNEDMQNLVLEYYGLDANNIKVVSPYDWKESGNLYWQGKAINRFSEEYKDFVIELYLSAIQNPLYYNCLKKIDKYIMHSIGETDEKQTVFTRYEFEKMLNCLVEYIRET